MLRSLGAGVLRFGGASADTRVAWTDAATPLPAWASFALQAGDFRHLRKLASESGWQILLTIGLAHYDPRAAAREAVAAKTALGGWLAGIEIGNEPDSYARHNLRAAPWTPARYNAEVSSYRRAIGLLAPGIALAGPGVSGSAAFTRWGPAEAIAQRPALLTGHHYPLGCHQLPAPTIARLLSPRTRRAEDASLRRYLVRVTCQRDRIPSRRDKQRLLRWAGRCQQHVRLGAVGSGLHRSSDARRRGRCQLSRQPSQLPGLHTRVRAEPPAAGAGSPRSPAGVVRATAEQRAHRRPPGARHHLPESGERRRHRTAEPPGEAPRGDRRRRPLYSQACHRRAARGTPLWSRDGSIADGAVARRDDRRPPGRCELSEATADGTHSQAWSTAPIEPA